MPSNAYLSDLKRHKTMKDAFLYLLKNFNPIITENILDRLNEARETPMLNKIELGIIEDTIELLNNIDINPEQKALEFRKEIKEKLKKLSDSELIQALKDLVANKAGVLDDKSFDEKLDKADDICISNLIKIALEEYLYEELFKENADQPKEVPTFKELVKESENTGNSFITDLIEFDEKNKIKSEQVEYLMSKKEYDVKNENGNYIGVNFCYVPSYDVIFIATRDGEDDVDDYTYYALESKYEKEWHTIIQSIMKKKLFPNNRNYKIFTTDNNVIKLIKKEYDIIKEDLDLDASFIDLIEFDEKGKFKLDVDIIPSKKTHIVKNTFNEGVKITFFLIPTFNSLFMEVFTVFENIDQEDDYEVYTNYYTFDFENIDQWYDIIESVYKNKKFPTNNNYQWFETMEEVVDFIKQTY